jgi:hypothetical protein
MAFISKIHPCNTFAGWLRVSGSEAAKAHQEQLRLRDAELEKDPRFSGEPPAFREWSIEQVRRLAGDPSVASQITKREEEIHQQLDSLDIEKARTLQRISDERQQLTQELALLGSLRSSPATV